MSPKAWGETTNHNYVRPEVRAVGPNTAHPSGEVWRPVELRPKVLKMAEPAGSLAVDAEAVPAEHPEEIEETQTTREKIAA